MSLTIRTPGVITDPTKDMIEGGNFAFFWTQGGVSICDPSGRGVGLCSPDAPALSLGEPGIYKFKGKWTNPKSSIYVHLFNNKWNTNFRSFWEGDLSVRVRLWPITGYTAERDLVTPSEETLAPMLTGLSNYKAGVLPPAMPGLSVSRKGITVTAFGPNPDGAGILLRLWEQSGTGGALTVTLPSELKATKAQPANLRGEESGQPIAITDHQLTFHLAAYAPASFILQCAP